MSLEEFQIRNSHLEGIFSDLDPHLRRLRDQPLIYRFLLLDRLPRNQPGIYTVGGGRQIGKPTLLEQWMAPARLRFFTGELIDGPHALVRLVLTLQREVPALHLARRSDLYRRLGQGDQVPRRRRLTRRRRAHCHRLGHGGRVFPAAEGQPRRSIFTSIP